MGMTRAAEFDLPPEPARITPPERALPILRYLRTLVRNPIETWPEPVYLMPLIKVRVFAQNNLLVCDPDLVRQVMVEEADAFEKPEAMRRVLAALGDGILTAGGQKWRRQRRVAAPVFRPDAIAASVPAMLDVAEATRERWLGLAAGSEIGLNHEMMRATFEIIVETMLSGSGGIDVAKVERSIGEYLGTTGWIMALSLMKAPTWVPFPGKRRNVGARGFLRESVGRIVADRRSGAERRDDLIQRLVDATDEETGQKMSEEEVTDNILTFITAGHETTALALTWTFYLLSLYPEVEARVLAEIAAVAGGRRPTVEELGRMTFTRQVLSEAMRLYPPAPVLIRTPTRPVKIGNETVLPGDQVIVPVYAIHRHRTLWPEPDAFRPERFAPEAVKARHRYAYLPFGAGPRICIGMGFALTEATAMLATLLPAVKLSPRPNYHPHPVMQITLRPEGGMPMSVTPRDNPPGSETRRAA